MALRWRTAGRRNGEGIGPVAKFALAGAVAVAGIAIAGFAYLRHVGTDEAIKDAKRITEIVGETTVQPNITDGLVAGRPGAIRRFDRVVRERVLGDPIVRVKIWSRSGRLIYSDEPRLIGSSYPLAQDKTDTFRSGDTYADVTDLSRPENRFDHNLGKLLEVYLPVHAPNGEPLLFEAYQKYDSVSTLGDNVWLAFAPALIVALILLELLQLPLARSMAKRIRKQQEEREALLQRAIDASDLERRRVARDLHDGPVQSLAGVSFSLSAAAERLGAAADPDKATLEALRRGASSSRQVLRELRRALVEIHPPNLEGAGLEGALDDLLSPLVDTGIESRVDVPSGVRLTPEAEAVMFRVAQEAVRNAVAHADPRKVSVAVVSENGSASLTVSDDGRGFEPEEERRRRDEGHVGLQLMREMVRDAGGEMQVESRAGLGTSIRVNIPQR
jgi:two-component system NarL family sensor kinase